MKTALITGATSGIGRATAILFAKNNINVIACGRREERLQELKEITSERAGKLTTLSFDVCDQQQVQEQLTSLGAQLSNIDILINNAGNAHGLAPFHEASMDDWEAMIDINCKGLLYVSRAITPSMIAKKSGHIINIGSIAGKEAYPSGNVYCASKFAVDALTQTMRMDLFKHGIKVGAVNPGLVDTEFSLVRFKGDADQADSVYKGYTPLHAEDIADILLFAVTRPSHVNIADLLVLPTDQASATLVNKTP
jgi:NADP-dependent 3-hydroxy acid dehydrogenase YdfG